MRPNFSSAILILAVSILATTGSEEEKNNAFNKIDKNTMVKNIVAKVTNMTLDSLSNADSDQKFEVLEKIRQKVVNASQFLGENGTKYVDIIMQGVHAVAFGDSGLPNIKRFKSRQGPADVEVDESTKSKLVRSIAKKIELLTQGAFYNANTNEEKQQILQNIMKRVVKAANKHKIMVRSRNEVKPYGDLVVEGVGLVVQQQLGNAIERRRINLLGNNTDLEVTNSTEEDVKNNAIDIMDVVKREVLPENQDSSPTTINPQVFTSNLDLCGCSCIVNKTCAKIFALSTFNCLVDKKKIPLEKMCNRVPDCSDKSDEENCSDNVAKSLRSASRILNEIEELLPRRCLKTTLEDNILTTQHIVLRNVLQRQLQFLDKYDPIKGSKRTGENEKEVYSEVNIVVSTVGFALQAAFCVHEAQFRSGELQEESTDDLLEERSWVAPRCACDKETCVHANCSSSCERTCWQRYGLGQWSCPAITFDFVVPLDSLCDGKIDCYDETDERGCNTGGSADKFEASDRFNTVLKLIQSKTLLNEYHPVLNKLNALRESIKTLQKHCSKMKPDLPTVKGLRDQCFAELTSIYEDVVQRAELVEKIDEAYIFLGAVSEKLIEALKLTTVGNERIVSNDDCLCRGEFCSASICSHTCVRACSVRAKITKYSCKNDKNMTIDLGSVCDGIPDCPKGDDEEHCQKEICRNHHLVVLRNKLHNLNDFHKGVAVGETLRAWKTKAIADLMVAEKKSRITRRGIRKLVGQILHDLTMSYATLGGLRRRKDKIEQSADRFLDLAVLVQSTMKTCMK